MTLPVTKHKQASNVSQGGERVLRELSEKGGLGQVREEKGKLRAALQFQLWSCPVGKGGFFSKRAPQWNKFNLSKIRS